MYEINYGFFCCRILEQERHFPPRKDPGDRCAFICHNMVLCSLCPVGLRILYQHIFVGPVFRTSGIQVYRPVFAQKSFLQVVLGAFHPSSLRSSLHSLPRHIPYIGLLLLFSIHFHTTLTYFPALCLIFLPLPSSYSFVAYPSNSFSLSHNNRFTRKKLQRLIAVLYSVS